MKHLYTLLIITFGSATYGQSIIGQWETFDDETTEKKAIIEIYKKKISFSPK